MVSWTSQYAGLPLCNHTPLPLTALLPSPPVMTPVITCVTGNTSAAGLQVAEYMEEMAEDSEENYNKHFSQFIAADLEGGGLEDLYKEVWALL